MDGTEVRPRRALEAFWRWEQTWARFTRDMVRDLVSGAEPVRAREEDCPVEV